MQSLNIWWDNTKVGTLTQNMKHALNFEYDKNWFNNSSLGALSISLPKRKEKYSTFECLPFFAGLLPEQRQRIIIAKNLGISSNNDFSLLEKLGEDVAGVFQILPAGNKPLKLISKLNTQSLTPEELVKKIDNLPSQPLLSGHSDLRVSLAGAQSKIPVVLIDGKIGLPVNGQPTTHILKPAIRNWPATTENEAFVMLLAKSIGLDVANIEPMSVQGRTFLLIERYDREIIDKHLVKRLHQEDFCQALGIMPQQKYQSKTGLNLPICFRLIKKNSIQPKKDILKLLDAVIYNLIVGNADAHGKNFSLLYGNKGPYLAPLYDLFSTVVYPELLPDSAMKIGRCKTLEELERSTTRKEKKDKGWNRFANKTSIEMGIIKERVNELCESILSELDKVSVLPNLMKSGLDFNAITHFASIIRNRAKRCKKTV